MAVRWMQNTGIMTLQETIKARVSVRNEKYIDEALVKRIYREYREGIFYIHKPELS